jgi:hypothetical protein
MAAQIVDLASFRASRAETAGLLLNKDPRDGGKDMNSLLIREEPRWADHRDESRHRLDGTCKLSLWLGGSEASLENISRNGLMAAADLPQDPGSRVPVSVGGGRSVMGLVIWKRDGLVGLELPAGSLERAS